MFRLRGYTWLCLLAAFLLALAGCGGGGTEEDGSVTISGGSATDLNFQLTSFARPGSSAASPSGFSQAFGLNKPAAITVTGELLAVNKGTGEEERFQFSLSVEEGTFNITGVFDIVSLPSGTYDLYFLLQANGTYYAGTVTNQIILDADGKSGVNLVKFTLNPVISDGEVTVDTIGKLVEFRFRYDLSEIESYTDPAFSLSVDGKPARVFNINQITGLPFVYVLLPPGTYHFVLKFYDGANVKLVAEDDVNIGEGSAEIDVAPVKTTITYTYIPSGSPETDQGDVAFVVPNTIIQEAGGIGNVQASASIVGPQTPLLESVLSLNQDGNNWIDQLNVPGLTAGTLHWSIQFRNLATGQLFAYCADEMEVLAPAPGEAPSRTFICEPYVLASNVSGAEQPATLTVHVADPAGSVSGTVVKVFDTDTLGITATGKIFGDSEGSVQVFLPATIYDVTAKHDFFDSASGEIKSRSAGESVGLGVGEDKHIFLDLGPLSEDVVPCADGTPLTARDSANFRDGTGEDGLCLVESPLDVTLTNKLSVVEGDIGETFATLSFENSDGTVVCYYQGNGSAGYLFKGCFQATTAAANDGSKELTPQAVKLVKTEVATELPKSGLLDIQLGDTVYADGLIRLSVDGSVSKVRTVVSYTLEAVPAIDEEPGEDPNPPGDDGGDENEPGLDFIELEASRAKWPRRYFDDHVRLAGWAKIKIPGQDMVSIVDDEGDPDNFMMIVYFGHGVKCWYVGGEAESSVAKWFDDFFNKNFSSPACSKGKGEGSTMWVRGPIKARVIAGSPRYAKTTVNVKIPVIKVKERNSDHEYDREWHNRRHWWHWWWWRDKGHWWHDQHRHNRGRHNRR